MKPVDEIDVLKNVSDVYFPVIWFDESAEIDDVWTKKFENMVTTPFLLVDICLRSRPINLNVGRQSVPQFKI